MHTSPWQHCRITTPLGTMRLARSAHGLCGAWFERDHKHPPAPERFAPEGLCPNDPLLQSAAQQLDAYFAGDLKNFDLPIDGSQGTAFQRAVWQALQSIGFGKVCTYGEIATAIDRPSASRAVGSAIGRNPLSIIVPCHRVLGCTGALTGYAGGLARKQALLRCEGHVL